MPIKMASSDGRFGLRITVPVVRAILNHCANAGSDETGGILLGRYAPERETVIVSRVTGPTKDSAAGPTWYHRGVRGLQKLLDDLWHRREAYYVGEWHFHPYVPPDPSPVDSRTMRSIARSADYNCPEPVLLIIGGDPRGLWWANSLVYSRQGTEIPLHEIGANS